MLILSRGLNFILKIHLWFESILIRAQAAECHKERVQPQHPRWGPLPRGGPGPRSSYSQRSTLTFPSLVPGFNSLKRVELLCILT